MDWAKLRQGLSDAGAKAKTWAGEHPTLMRYAGIFLAGAIVGFILGKA